MLQGVVGDQGAQYLVYGHETGESGTHHLQGYVEWSKKISLKSLKKHLGTKRIHLEKANGSLDQNQAYCKKEGGVVFEDGTPMRPVGQLDHQLEDLFISTPNCINCYAQGKRNDLLEIKDLLDKGASQAVIAEQHFSKWVVYRRSFQAYTALKMKDRYFKTIVIVLWGLTGTGKTRYVWDQVQDRTIWCPGDYQWFDGYEGQDIVLLDDYRGEYAIQMLLKLLDRYPMSVPVKGSFRKWSPKKIYITSNLDPHGWYPDAHHESIKAMFRRFTAVEHIMENLY